MPDSRTEAELLKQACSGNESAFLTIYEVHRGIIFRFAYRLLGSAAAAEDITHDCFLSLLQKPQRFDPNRASLGTYLYAAARNLALQQLRRRNIEVGADDADNNQNACSDDPFEIVSSFEIAEAVRMAVASLPVFQREAIILFELEGLSLADVAMVVQADVGTVKSRLHRARRRLRGLLTPWFPSADIDANKETKS